MRARVPVLVAGEVRSNPYEKYGAEAAAGDHVVGPCERLAIAPSPEHSRIATEALVSALGTSTDAAMATVSRRRDGLHATLETDPSVDPKAVTAATPKVMAALRAYDRHTPRIDVSIVPCKTSG